MDALAAFHPAVRTWFERRFAAGPTEPQRFGWPAIAEGRDTLIAAPTGTGKTLSAFLVCIDRLFRAGQALSEEPFRLTPSPGPRRRRQHAAPREPACTQVVYVSPLKALAADIHHNLEEPLAEIREVASELGYAAPELRVALRTGDTPASARAAMLRRPPHLLVTTPESLYLLLTAEKSRAMLRGVRTLIVDEIHALARDKRGSHLALSLERLDELCEQRPVRIGLSATQRPVETVARLLVGAGPDRSEADGSPRCTVVDVGHRRELDLCLELPESELEAVASGEQLAEVLDRIAERVREHRTTLIFVNTRRLAERLAHMLADRLGEEGVAAHHGSLSRERRLRVEAQLRAGELRALVATASLELGIDVGPVELVCQIGSPRGLSTFIQRVGRSGHHLGGIPKGVLFPLTRDELVECAALLHGVRAGELDALTPPRAPLDILAQQIVASCAAESCSEDELFAWVRRAAPFAEVARADFDEIVEMLSEGITTGRGRRGAYLHRDRVHGLLRARRGARIAAVTCGGAIPETADYRVVADPDDTFVGTVDEDWAIESMAGDIFLLGSTSWKIRRVESGVVRVVDAGGAPPTVPFWMGEAPARSEELSREVSDLRERVNVDLGSVGAVAAAARVAGECGLSERAARELVTYLDVSRTALGTLPTRERVVFERFFDEAGGMQLVVHSPAGGRLNRALGLALRKRFCRRFDFELQAAANDDAVVLSLGPQHSFPLQEVPGYLNSNSVEEVLSQALLASPMFTARWRWNLNRALVVLRNYGGKRNPPAIQRMQADDMMA
ncbi:MAG: DEAD/DEAH box helicase, partial [Myxococcales bacterium]|nr:DEAD/DEAH box helicase [Myxococcales bacterium]